MRTEDVHPNVTLVRWPADASLRAHLQRLGRPRVLLVEHGTELPDLDRLEDWVLVGADHREIDLRSDMLVRRLATRPTERPVLEDGDLLRFDGDWVALSPTETKVVRTLLDRFDHCVGREALEALTGGSRGPSSLNSLVKRLRTRIAPLGLTVNNVHGRGYVLSTRAFDSPVPVAPRMGSTRP